MGLKEDLKFKGNDFSNVASAYAIAHLLMQIPNGIVQNYCLRSRAEGQQLTSSNAFRHPNGSRYAFWLGV
jgi:hypothetical protein